MFTKFVIAYPAKNEKRFYTIVSYENNNPVYRGCNIPVNEIVQSMVVFDPVYFAPNDEFFYRYENIFYNHQN